MVLQAQNIQLIFAGSQAMQRLIDVKCNDNTVFVERRNYNDCQSN